MLLITLFACLNFLQHKKIEQQYLVIIPWYWAKSSELQVDLRDPLIVFSEVGL